MANKNNLIKIIGILLTTATVFNANSPYNVLCVDSKVDREKRKQKALEQKSEELKRQLDNAKKIESAKKHDMEQLREQVGGLSAKIKNESEALVVLQRGLEDGEQKLNDKKTSAANKFKLLQKAANQFSKKKELDVWEFLLGKAGPDEYLKYMEWVSKAYKRQSDALKDEMLKIQLANTDLLEQKRNMQAKIDELNRMKSELSAKVQQMGTELEKIKKVEEVTQKQIEETNAARARQEKIIEKAVQEAIIREQARLAALKAKLEAERRAREKKLADERAKREAERAAAIARGEEVKEDEPKSVQPVKENAMLGSAIWPTPEFHKITAPFGEPRGSVTHKGTDIGGAGIHGAPVVAMWDGIVVYTFTGCTHDYGKSGSCGCDGGCGNCVVVAHPDGTTTHYYHLSAVCVVVGQNVARGETIGAVGSTGWSTGPHLHLGVKKDGRWENPMNYFKT